MITLLLEICAAAEPSAAERELAWVLAALAEPPADGAARFTDDFNRAVPDLGALFARFGTDLGSVTVVRLERDTPSEVVAIVSTERAGPFRIFVLVAPDGRIGGLWFRPASDLLPVPGSWEAIDARLAEVAPRVGFLAAEITAGECRAIHAVAPSEPLALGSTFKLYVLDALARSIAAGERAWTDELPIRDDHKSLPAGDLRNEPAGSRFTVRKLAELMISVSDNTATDHLLYAIGRDAVEDATAASGNLRNTPFLATREAFALKLLKDPAAYVAASPKKREKLVERTAGLDLGPAMSVPWTEPRQIDAIEWFATPVELCAEMLTLRSYGDPVQDVLTINPGVADPTGRWRTIAYKGGSEPGVLNLTWTLERDDGRWFFLTVGFNDPLRPLDENAGVAAAAAARAFLATTP